MISLKRDRLDRLLNEDYSKGVRVLGNFQSRSYYYIIGMKWKL